MKRKIYILDRHTNGHDAALRIIRQQGWRRRDCDLIFCGSHKEVLNRLAEGPGYAVVAARNSLKGEVGEVARQMSVLTHKGYAFEKRAEHKLRINHCLVAPKHVTDVAQITRVISHEQALMQCQPYLDTIGIPAAARNGRNSTAAAAKLVSEMGPGSTIAALASKEAARAYDLRILAQGIHPRNFTTFHLLENCAQIEAVTVGIIGIQGRFGQFLKLFFQGLGCKVIGSDPKLPGMSNAEVVQRSDVVIFSVPIKEAPLTIDAVREHIRPDQLLMDVTSVKVPAVLAMTKTKAQVVGLHPMFAPESGFDGQTIVVCPERLTNPRWKTWVMNVLAATSSKIKWSTPKEHDRYMATVQASPHLANMIGAVLIMEMGVSTQESLTFTSPFYRVMFSLMGRFLNQNPDMYSAIIMKNAASIPMVRKRIDIERRLLKMIKGYDREGFRTLFKKARDHFGKKVTKEADELFQRIIAVMKTLYGKNAVILEFRQAHDQPGLLEKILAVFRRRGVNLLGINSANLDDQYQQIAMSFEQPKSSEAVQRAFATISSWDSPKVRIIDLSS